MKTLPLPSSDLLNRIFKYDPETGLVTAKVARPRVKLGGHIGSLKHGYYRVCVENQLYQLHRIIWRMVTGEDPGPSEVDHEDCDRLNNRWINLRLATTSGNQQNKKLQANNISGVKGVHWDTRYQKWCAQIKVNGVRKFLGYHNSVEEGAEAVRIYREQLHKEFTNHG